MALRLGAGKVRPSYSYKAQCTRCRVSSDEGSAMEEIKPFQDSHQCSAETATARKRPTPLVPQLMGKDGKPLQGKRPPSDIILTSQWIEPTDFKISIECDWCNKPVAESEMKHHDSIDCMNPQSGKTVSVEEDSITVKTSAVSSKKRSKQEQDNTDTDGDFSPSSDEAQESVPKKSRRFQPSEDTSSTTINQYKWCQYHDTTGCGKFEYTNMKGKLAPKKQEALGKHEAKCRQLYDSIIASRQGGVAE